MLVVYGGFNETHEIAFSGCSKYRILEGAGLIIQEQNGDLLVNWPVTSERKLLQIEDSLFVYILGELLLSNEERTED